MLNFKPLTDDEYTIYSGEGQNFQIPVNIQANNSFKLLAERLMSKIIPVVFGSSDSWQN
jgi:hypothetical protein